MGEEMSKEESLKNLQTIPGIGKSIARNLWDIGARQDPCLLYTFRCAVYYAKTKNPKPDLLKWWNWKDRV
jgi:hypothetical protein